MLYRKMNNTDLSILGFGCMRLPVTADGNIDEPLATKILHYAIDHGVNLWIRPGPTLCVLNKKIPQFT
jgi:predicted aldo/keto reductase-like oxidoreductase